MARGIAEKNKRISTRQAFKALVDAGLFTKEQAALKEKLVRPKLVRQKETLLFSEKLLFQEAQAFARKNGPGGNWKSEKLKQEFIGKTRSLSAIRVKVNINRQLRGLIPKRFPEIKY